VDLKQNGQQGNKFACLLGRGAGYRLSMRLTCSHGHALGPIAEALDRILAERP